MSLSRIDTFKFAAILAGALTLIFAGNAHAQCGAAAATMISPANGTALPGASTMFTWNPGPCNAIYILSVGSTAGGADIYAAGQGGNLTAIVNNIPTDGRNIFVRLTTSNSGNEVSNDYTYQAANGAGGGGGGNGCVAPAAAVITNPIAGSILPGATATFQWNAGSCVTQYTLSIGNSVGGTDIYSANQGANQSVTVGSLPTDGRTLFVRLTSTINGNPQSSDTTYRAFTPSGNCGASTLAAMTSPANGSTLPGATATFTWSASCNGITYFLYIGSTAGSSDLYFVNQGLQLTTTVNNLPTDGRTLYVRLWTRFPDVNDVSNGWQFNDYVYHAATGTVACVGTPSPGVITSPGPGSALSASSVAFQWTTGNCVTQFTLSVGSSAGGTDIYSASQGTNVSTTVTLPTDGRALFVRLTSTFADSSSQSNDYTYTAFNGAFVCGATALATMQSPAPGSTLSGTSATFTWNPGCHVTTYFLYVGSAPGASDLYFVNQGLGLTTTVGNLPVDGRTIFVRLWSFFSNAPGFADGWQFNDYTYQTSQSGTCVSPNPGAMTSPANNSTFGGSSVNFQWTPGSCVTQFTLSVGSSAAGSSDIYTASQGINTSATVPNIPTDGRQIFVRLTSTINGNPQSVDYTYTAFQSLTGCGASTLAALTSPANGTTLTGSSATFTWSAGCNATQYFLYIGNSPGTYDILFQNQNTGLSTTVNVPTDGRTLYVRLWSFFTAVNDINNGWLFNDYVFHASN